MRWRWWQRGSAAEWCRFEGLEDLVMRGSEARTRQSEDLLRLKAETGGLKDGLAATDATVRNLKAAAASHGGKLEELSSQALLANAQLRELQGQSSQLLNTVRTPPHGTSPHAPKLCAPLHTHRHHASMRR
jgi:chromosome segregation ATPase